MRPRRAGPAAGSQDHPSHASHARIAPRRGHGQQPNGQPGASATNRRGRPDRAPRTAAQHRTKARAPRHHRHGSAGERGTYSASHGGERGGRRRGREATNRGTWGHPRQEDRDGRQDSTPRSSAQPEYDAGETCAARKSPWHGNCRNRKHKIGPRTANARDPGSSSRPSSHTGIYLRVPSNRCTIVWVKFHRSFARLLPVIVTSAQVAGTFIASTLFRRA